MSEAHATNTVNTIALAGCRPTPLSSYLKALGVLRLVSEQEDPSTLGFWMEGHFHLQTRLVEEGLTQFFMERYQPTPLLGPWGARSGFYPAGSEKKAREALERIGQSDAERLAPFRQGIAAVKALLQHLDIKEKPDKGTDKERLLKACRAQLPDSFLPWLDATYVLSEGRQQFPPLLGTGGNEGSGSYMSGYAQQVAELLLDNPNPRALGAALFADGSAGVLGKQTPGQFDPGAMGGANAATGFEGIAHTNSWDYILMLEGTLAFTGALSRKADRQTPGAMAFPFTVKSTSSGYGSAASGDEAKSRGESWLPLWNRPASFVELKALFAEGRADLNRRRSRNGVDFARALASLGVDRGIIAFERYGYLERNGQSTIAVSLGHWPVRHKPEARLIEELDTWLDRFRGLAQGNQAPASWNRALRRIDRTIMEVLAQSVPHRWQALLIALGGAEATLSRSTGNPVDKMQKRNLGPLPPLDTSWLVQADDGNAEFRVACALASLKPVWVKNDLILPTLRGHLIPLKNRSTFPAFTETMKSPTRAWSQAGLVPALNAVLLNRLGRARKLGLPFPPLTGVYPLDSADVAAFLNGQLDDRRIEGLLWGLNAVKWHQFEQEQAQGPYDFIPPPALFSILRLAYLPYGVDGIGEKIENMASDISAIKALLANRPETALSIAIRRLRAKGIQPLSLSGFSVTPEQGRRMAAALMLPLTARNMRSMAYEVTRTARRKAE